MWDRPRVNAAFSMTAGTGAARRRSECGIWVVRRGMSQEVHRSERGFRLEPGDEIHFGRAVVVFEVQPRL